jgi:hypothetical protein
LELYRADDYTSEPDILCKTAHTAKNSFSLRIFAAWTSVFDELAKVSNVDQLSPFVEQSLAARVLLLSLFQVI